MIVALNSAVCVEGNKDINSSNWSFNPSELKSSASSIIVNLSLSSFILLDLMSSIILPGVPIIICGLCFNWLICVL